MHESRSVTKLLHAQVIFQVSLVILDKLLEQLAVCKDEGEAMTIMSTYLEGVTNDDATLPPNPNKTLSNITTETVTVS